MSRHLGRQPRCISCRLQTYLCVCRHIRPVPTETRVVVVIHPREHNKPSNTGHLARRALPSAEVRVANASGLIPGPLEPDPRRRVFLLFPRPDAEVLDARLRDADPRPITLVVPDAHWRLARKMASHWSCFRDLPAVVLPGGPPRRFGLRKSRNDSGALATLEAIGRALGILECQYVEDEIEALHARFVLRGLYARGRAAADAELRHELAEQRALGLEIP